MANNTLLKITALSKSFPGVHALKDIDFNLKKGEVHALIGENGAGKSTFLNILSGNINAGKGTINFEGKNIIIKNTKMARDIGIAMTYQELSLVPQLSVAENIFLGRYFYKNKLLSFIDWNMIYSKAEEEFDKHRLNIDVRKKINKLGIGLRQLVEIIRSVSRDVKILLLDEPTSALSKEEIDILFKNIINVQKKRGTAIIYVSHRIEEIFKIADRVSVFKDGEKVKTLNIEETDKEELIRLMIGSKIIKRYSKIRTNTGKTVLRVENLTAKGLCKDCSIDVRKSEVVGLAGLMGSGRTEFAKTLIGLYKKDEGRIFKNGKEVKIKNPREALNTGIAYLGENRSEGLIYPLNVCFNITLSNFREIFNMGILNKNKENAVGKEFVNKLNIETPSLKQKVVFLSGGNQQKVIFARLIYSNVDVFILDEPTRGIDVGAKIEVYNLINELLKDGKSIILISSELPEILNLSDRVFVMYEGTIVAEYSGDEMTHENIIRSAMGRGKAKFA